MTTTAQTALDKSDRAILRQLAYAAMSVKDAQDALTQAAEHGPDMIQHAAANLARTSAALEGVRIVAIASGAATRHAVLAGEAMAGDDTNI